MSLEERVALLDSGFHPILSLSHGSLFEGRRQLEGRSSHSFPVSSPQPHALCPAPPPAPPSSQIPLAASSAMASKRRKAECSYDIDNVVIPMSKAAATRVEKPQYKEIVVPSWRIVELEGLQPFNQADSELEDTSDEMYSSHHSKHEDLERARWDSWAAATSHKRGSRSSSKAEGRWAGQPPPASPVTGFNCLNDLYARPSTGLHSPETCNALQSLSVHSRTRTALPCSEDATSSPEMLDGAVQNVQPWEPRTFPLSDAAYQGLLQHPSEDGCDQADFQPWGSSNKQGVGLISTGPVRPSFTGMRFSDTQLQADGNKSAEEVMVQRCNPAKLVNSDTPDLWCV
ncbi:KAT8 regulatory NSL complex subunit 1-like isoform X2 [Egretta garzetta]|uniref:KAT8 regulatory NSL complex subunit 1-like isoform X2 n=1 Tax=Egretta garzetta TaxID=188379 RepID=UPI00163CF78B|nr:KAT8 regulatory NSL complex subunit 1-like isoform X2 [Egretta garzetta]